MTRLPSGPFVAHDPQLGETAPDQEAKTTSGRIPLDKASNIKLRPELDYSLAIMVDEEIIGTLSEGADKRIIGLLKELAKDIKEQNNG